MSNKPTTFTTTDEGIQSSRQQQSIPTTATSILPVFVTTTTTTTLPSSLREPKTSISHPINISWIIPNDALRFLSLVGSFPDNLDLYDYIKCSIKDKWTKYEEQYCRKWKKQMPPIVMKGNLCLSSCPGKKVRLNGPIRGRAAINRDLDLDFERMKKFQITTIVCCLGDEELAFLGAPWPKYAKSAKEHGIGIIRLPMVEGHCPKTIFEMREVVRKVNIEMSKGHNVLAHCRGGVGRAGLLAGCWLLENSLCKDVERTVTVLRQRRSAKAIETCVQAEFLIRYAMTVNRPLDNTNQDLIVFEGPQAPCVLEAGPPSLPIIAELERFIRSSLRPDTSIQQQQQKVNNDLVKTTVSSIPAVVLPATTTTNVSSPSSPTRIHNTTELLYSPRY